MKNLYTVFMPEYIIIRRRKILDIEQILIYTFRFFPNTSDFFPKCPVSDIDLLADSFELT
ncbi:MAG: hypothetical protein ACP5E3_07415 [Bacteroidales bacterium]